MAAAIEEEMDASDDPIATWDDDDDARASEDPIAPNVISGEGRGGGCVPCGSSSLYDGHRNWLFGFSPITAK